MTEWKLVPDGWKLNRVDKEQFNRIEIRSPNGYVTVADSIARPPANILYMLADALLAAAPTPPDAAQQGTLTDDAIALLKDARSAIEEYDAGLENMLGEFSKDVDEYVRGLLVRARALLAHNTGDKHE